MNDTYSGIGGGWWGVIIVIFLLFIVCGWGNRGFGGGNNCGVGSGLPFGGFAFPGGAATEYLSFQNNKSICDAERMEIINTATTRYDIAQQGTQTREAVNAAAQATQAKIDFYAYQELRDKLAEAQRENAALQNQVFIKAQLEPISTQIADLQCNCLRAPKLTALASSCSPVLAPSVLSTLGVGGCGCNGGLNA